MFHEVGMPPAGTITQTTLGMAIFSASSEGDDPPVVRSSPAIALTESGLWSYATDSCPSLTTRRTMLAPIGPKPFIPSCSCSGLLLALRACSETSIALANRGDHAA